MPDDKKISDLNETSQNILKYYVKCMCTNSSKNTENSINAKLPDGSDEKLTESSINAKLPGGSDEELRAQYPITLAIVLDNSVMLKDLLDNGASLTVKDEFNNHKTPLELAGDLGKEKLVKILNEHKAKSPVNPHGNNKNIMWKKNTKTEKNNVNKSQGDSSYTPLLVNSGLNCYIL